MKLIYKNKNKNQICQLLTDNRINYFTVQDTQNDQNLPVIDVQFFQNNFQPAYLNLQNNFFIYDVQTSCL